MNKVICRKCRMEPNKDGSCNCMRASGSSSATLLEARHTTITKMKTGTELIAEERARQINSENWTASHDDGHKRMEMSQAAVAYASAAVLLVLDASSVADISTSRPMDWPWARKWWKPSNEPIRNLVKAGALIAAEIDRLQRASNEKGQL